MNNKFTIKCNEKYTNLKHIEFDIKDIVRDIIPPKDFRDEFIKNLEKELTIQESEKQYKISENTKKIEVLKLKLGEITESFIDGKISKDVFELSSSKINEDINILRQGNEGFKDNGKFILVTRKIIRLIEILGIWEAKLDEFSGIKKSSQLFSLFFKCVENLTIGDRKISSCQYFQPFNILNNINFTKWLSTSTLLRTFYMDNPSFNNEKLLLDDYLDFGEYLGNYNYKNKK